MLAALGLRQLPAEAPGTPSWSTAATHPIDMLRRDNARRFRPAMSRATLKAMPAGTIS